MAQEEILRKDLKGKTMQELVDMYNVVAEKKVKKFSKKQVGIDKIVGLMVVHTVENPVVEKKKNIRVLDLIYENGSLCNADFAKLKQFKNYCETAKIEPTKRQASKFRNQRGLAYAVA